MDDDDVCNAQDVITENADGIFTSGVHRERRLDLRGRRWVFTAWAKDGQDFEAVREACRGFLAAHGVLFGALVEDVGSTGKHHFHGAVQISHMNVATGEPVGDAVFLKTILSWLPEAFRHFWFDPAKAWDGMLAYIESKDFPVEYFGKYGKSKKKDGSKKSTGQGQRVDLEELKAALLSGGTSAVAELDAGSFLKYGRARLSEFQQELLRPALMKRRLVVVMAVAGATDIGKSSFVKDALDYGNYGELATDTDKGKRVLWCDSVEPEHKAIVCDEFNSTRCVLQEINRLCDGTPFKAQVKGGHMYQCWSAVVFLSNVHVKEWFDGERLELYESFQRRVPEDMRFEYFDNTRPHMLYDCGAAMERAGDFRMSPSPLRAGMVKLLRHCGLAVNPTLLDGCCESVARRCVAVFAGPAPHVWPEFSSVEVVPPSVVRMCGVAGCSLVADVMVPVVVAEVGGMWFCRHHYCHVAADCQVVDGVVFLYNEAATARARVEWFGPGRRCELCVPFGLGHRRLRRRSVHIDDDDDVEDVGVDEVPGPLPVVARSKSSGGSVAVKRPKRLRRKSVSVGPEYDTGACPPSVIPSSPKEVEEDAQEDRVMSNHVE